MKNWILFILLFTGLNGQCGSFPFPNIPFSYAKLYLFNLDLEEPHMMDFMIYQDGVYAASKLGNGTLLSPEFHEKIQASFKSGVDELIRGLGKCYMPRHGIIYFDAEGTPIASLSICFECDRISIWSVQPYRFKDHSAGYNPSNTAKKYDKAERQMEDLVKIVKAEGIPVYTSLSEKDRYWRHLKKDSSFLKPTLIERKAATELDEIMTEISQQELRTWVNSPGAPQFVASLDTTHTSTGAMSGDIRIGFEDKSYFKFKGKYLNFAHIESTRMTLPNDIAVGMSVAELYQRFNYEKPEGAYPTSATISNEFWKIKLDFTYGTLRTIELARL